MAEHQLGLLRIMVVSPEIPLPSRVERVRAVCFCGRPLPRWRKRHVVYCCPECGWRPAHLRGGDPDEALLEAEGIALALG